MTEHYKPKRLSDRLAGCFVCFLRKPVDAYFGKDYMRRSLVIETIAALPGMIGGKFQHYKALRWIRPENPVIHVLLAEAENERSHLMALLSAGGRPSRLDRILVWPAQMVFCVAYSLAYILSPRVCHRFVGYLEEEATRSYGFFLDEIAAGRIHNAGVPAATRHLWALPDDARLAELVIAIRADEMRHRDNNHKIASQMEKHGA